MSACSAGRAPDRRRRAAGVDAVGRAGGAGRAGGDPARPLRHHAARRADERPRLRRPVPARGHGGPTRRRHGDRVARPGLPRPHRDRRPRARRARAPRPHLRRRLGGATRPSVPPTRRTPPTTTPSTRRSGPSCGSGPSASASGRPPAWPGRRSSRATTTSRSGTSASSGPRRWRGGPGGPSAPSTRSRSSRSPGRAGTCASPSARRPGPATSSCAWRTLSSSGATSRSARSPWTSPGPIGSRSSVRTGRARRRSSRRCSDASRWHRGTRRLGPSVVIGELAQDRRVLGDGPNLADAFTAATGLPRDQARSQLAKFGLGADAVLRPSRFALAGRAHPGRAGRVRRARRQLPRARRTDQPPRSPRHRTAGVGAAQLRRDAPARLARPAAARDGQRRPAASSCQHAATRSRAPREA